MRQVLRQEKKFLIDLTVAAQLQARLRHVLKEDAHGGPRGYRLRSLYFDTVHDRDYVEKLFGTNPRRKVRLLTYDPTSDFALLECKQKDGDNQVKRSLPCNREEAERLIAGDARWMLARPEPFAQVAPMRACVINYLRLSGAGREGRDPEAPADRRRFVKALMDDDREDQDVRLACVRYFMSRPWGPALESLLALAGEQDPTRWEYAAVAAFFILYLVGYATFLFLSVSVGSSILNRRKREARYRSHIARDCYVPVSLLVPAHNEGVTIVESVRSLLTLDYRLYEVIIVDDGSTDDTAQKVIEAFGLEPVERPIRQVLPTKPVTGMWMGAAGGVQLMLVRKENGGKSDALNVGINASRYPYFICMDADSMLQRDSLREIVAPVIEDDSVVAVGGLVRPANGITMEDGRVQGYSLPKRVIPAMQVLEYGRSFLSARILLDQFNGNLIISGAFGLFRKDLVIAIGGYDPATVGEDMELVTCLHVFCRGNGRPYRIRYAPDAVCWS